MKPFKLIQGNSKNIKQFEDEISDAMENGYELSGELVAVNLTANEVILLQPMTMEEHLDFEDSDLDYSSTDEEDL